MINLNSFMKFKSFLYLKFNSIQVCWANVILMLKTKACWPKINVDTKNKFVIKQCYFCENTSPNLCVIAKI